MLAATETTKDSILSIIITPFQKRQVLGSEKIIAQNLCSEQYFRRCVCVFLVHFGVEDSLDMADLFCIIGEFAGGDVMRLFCVWLTVFSPRCHLTSKIQ